MLIGGRKSYFLVAFFAPVLATTLGAALDLVGVLLGLTTVVPFFVTGFDAAVVCLRAVVVFLIEVASRAGLCVSRYQELLGEGPVAGPRRAEPSIKMLIATSSVSNLL